VSQVPIEIRRVGDLYQATVTPPHGYGPWSTPEPMSVDDLDKKLFELGCHPTDIGDVFYEADANWVDLSKQCERHVRGPTSIESHYSTFFGPPRAVYSASGETDEFSVDLFRDVPCAGATTLLTRGLSDLGELHREGHPLLQELMFSFWDGFDAEKLIELLVLIGHETVEGRRPLLWGEVLPPGGPILPGVALSAFYVAQPSYLAPTFGELEQEQGTVRIRWLVPLYDHEATWVEQHGHERFEDLLETQDPDLLDLRRPSLSLPD
jgi:hypothetical protein